MFVMSEFYDICFKIAISSGFDSEASFNAGHDFFEVRLDYSIEYLAAFLAAVQKPAPLHQSQVFRCHGSWQPATLSKFAHRILAS